MIEDDNLKQKLKNRIAQCKQYREDMRKLVMQRPLYDDEIIRLETAIIIEQELEFQLV